MNIEKHFSEIYSLIIEARNNVLKSVNKELIELYWRIGEYISKKVHQSNWGENVVQQLADYLKSQEPDLKGFSAQNLWRMRQFYEVYHDNEKLSPLVRELSWTNNLLILSKTKTAEEKEFYIRLSVKERYSKRELERQIDSGYFERTMIPDKSFTPKIKKLYPNIDEVLKDNYVLDFLKLPKDYDERDLQKAILRNLKDFILEIGKDFTLLGEEYRLQVGKKDFNIDLLFFHRELQCLVAIELKIQEYKPEFMGKMDFYLETLDATIKKPHENPSVGIILCKSKDADVVEFSLRRSISPAMIAEYETKLIDKKILRDKLNELFQLAEGNSKKE